MGLEHFIGNFHSLIVYKIRSGTALNQESQVLDYGVVLFKKSTFFVQLLFENEENIVYLMLFSRFYPFINKRFEWFFHSRLKFLAGVGS